MTVTLDSTNKPWVYCYGTATEVTGQLKADNTPVDSVVAICFTSGTTFYAFYRRGP